MIINKKQVEAEWFDYKGAKLLIRPYPFSVVASNVVNYERNYNAFSYALQDWKEVKDETDVIFEYNEENKKFLFDYDVECSAFVIDKANEKRFKIFEEIKN